jgi:hypothetical protein
MAKPYSVSISLPDADSLDSPSSRPRGRRLLVARIVWLAPPRHVQDLDHQLLDSRGLTSPGLK